MNNNKVKDENIDKIKEVKKLIDDAENVLIGAGAGLSTSAGIDYGGQRFKEKFADYIEKYGFTDMYTAGFYNFKTEEEKWAYWARHAYINNIGMNGTLLYKNILKLFKEKNYFVITTNADDQFFKTGFDKNKIFRVQGSYRYIQCKTGCHNKIYDFTELDKEMLDKTKNFKIPTGLISKCPVCGGPMEMNLRKDNSFVQDDEWYIESKNYEEFLSTNKDKKVLLLELGVGFNTPGIIRFPFEQMTYQNKNWKLVRINRENANNWVADIDNKSILIEDDINIVIEKLVNNFIHY